MEYPLAATSYVPVAERTCIIEPLITDAVPVLVNVWFVVPSVPVATFVKIYFLTVPVSAPSAAPLLPDIAIPLLSVSAAAWAGAFLGFGLAYGPLLALPRRDMEALRRAAG